MKAELKKIETVRLKFAAADLSSIKKNSFDQKKEHWKNDKRDQSGEKRELANEKSLPPKKVDAPKTYYRALPTVSGLKLDQALLSKLCEMGFDRSLATQGIGKSCSFGVSQSRVRNHDNNRARFSRSVRFLKYFFEMKLKIFLDLQDCKYQN